MIYSFVNQIIILKFLDQDDQSEIADSVRELNSQYDEESKGNFYLNLLTYVKN